MDAVHGGLFVADAGDGEVGRERAAVRFDRFQPARAEEGGRLRAEMEADRDAAARRAGCKTSQDDCCLTGRVVEGVQVGPCRREVADFDEFGRREPHVFRAAADQQVDALQRQRVQAADLAVLRQQADGVERHVAGADDDRAPRAGETGRRGGFGVAVDPADEAAGRFGQFLAGDAQPAVHRRARRQRHRVIVAAEGGEA